MDDEIVDNIKKYLRTHENGELETLLDDINTALVHDMYPTTQLYEADEILRHFEQIERIKDLDERIKREEEDFQKLMGIKESKQRKKGSLKN